MRYVRGGSTVLAFWGLNDYVIYPILYSFHTSWIQMMYIGWVRFQPPNGKTLYGILVLPSQLSGRTAGGTIFGSLGIS